MLKMLALTFCWIGILEAHSWMTCPPSFDNKVIQRGGIQGNWCETLRGGSPTTHVKAGDRLKVGWTSNNHAGGWVRISLVPWGWMDLDAGDKEVELKRNVMKIACYGHDQREGKTRNGDCVHPCDGRPGCDYQADDKDIHRFDTTIGIPTNLEDGDYVLQVTMLVGNTGTPYNSCGRLRISGGNPNFDCVNSDPVLVYDCLKSGGPRPENSIGVGTKNGDFCYNLDGTKGSIDARISQIPINVECDARLSCLNSVKAAECAKDQTMGEIVGARGPFPKHPVCRAYNVLEKLAPSCKDGLKNGDEEGVDCGGENCGACPTDPSPTVPATAYYSAIGQVSQLWWGSGQITIKVSIRKRISSSQCWQLLLQFRNTIKMTAHAWGDGMLVNQGEAGRTMIFEASNQGRSWSSGSTISVTFPINKGSINDDEWTDGNMKFNSAIFEVFDDTKECKGIKVNPN
eukprot:TCONS_00005146-protein